jgi:hypothetical protein
VAREAELERELDQRALVLAQRLDAGAHAQLVAVLVQRGAGLAAEGVAQVEHREADGACQVGEPQVLAPALAQ